MIKANSYVLLEEYLNYLGVIKARSPCTITEYRIDVQDFLRWLALSEMTVRSLQNTVRKYVKLAGLDPNTITPHKLRHTSATLMYKYGKVDIRSLQQILGHESIAATEIYTHIDERQLQAAVNSNALAVMFI